MTTYTIRVINQSGASKSYFAFLQPPGVTTPIYDNVWVTLDNITDGAFDSVIYAPDGPAQTVKDPPAPCFLVTEGVYAPGQVIEPPKNANFAMIDFAGRPQTTAAVTEHPDGGFSVDFD